jgi:protein gp37
VGCAGACPYCYARKMAHRFHRDFTPHWVERNFQRAMPKKPSRIFVNSMSDPADWEPNWVDRIDARMAEHPEHLFLILTKNPGAVPERINWASRHNILLGASATTANSLLRFVNLLAMKQIRFLSIEPIHGDMDLGRLTEEQAEGLRWIIVGAETGNRKERVVPKFEWLADIYTFARTHSIPIFFKQSLRSFWPYDPSADSGLDCFPQEYPA